MLRSSYSYCALVLLIAAIGIGSAQSQSNIISYRDEQFCTVAFGGAGSNEYMEFSGFTNAKTMYPYAKLICKSKYYDQDCEVETPYKKVTSQAKSSLRRHSSAHYRTLDV